MSGELALRALGLALAICGAYVLALELPPYLRGQQTSTNRVIRSADEAPRVPFSISGQSLLLLDCRQDMWSVAAHVLPTDARTRFLENCFSASDGIARASPTFSMAWLTSAIAAVESGDAAGFSERFVRSRFTAPYETWIAEARFEVAERYLSSLNPQAVEQHEADVRMLVSSERGIDFVAERYVSDYDFRDRVTAIVSTMSDKDQRRFVRAVERAAGGSLS
jgi:hypothetical protein